MVFVTAMAFFSALYQLWSLYTSANYFLLVMDILIIVAAVYVMLEALSAMAAAKRAIAEKSEAARLMRAQAP
jgi:carbon starvation protein